MASRADGLRPRAPRPPGPTIHDVARGAGVSTATVSRALRGVDHVSAPTRDRVLSVAATLGYVASPTAVSLASGRTGVVAVLVPYVGRWFFAQALDAVETTLRGRGLHVLLVNVGETSPSHTLREPGLLRGRVDGLIVLSCDLSRGEVALLSSLHVPVVSVGVDVAPWDRVGIDDRATARSAMEHLLALGHTRIGYLGGDPSRDVNRATAEDRRRGARDAAEQAGACLVEVVGDWTVSGGLRAVDQLLAGPRPPTAVLAASDEMAVGVLCAARARGLVVPDDLSVMGVDDHEFAVTHDLTTVAQPVRRLGDTAARLLVDRLDGVPAERRSTTLPTTVVVRGSTAPPKG